MEISGFGQRARAASHYPAPPDSPLTNDGGPRRTAAECGGPLTDDRTPRRNAALGEGEVGGEVGGEGVVGVGSEGEGKHAEPPLADLELAELLQRAMPPGTPPPDREMLGKVKALLPPGGLRDVELAVSPFLTGKRRPPNTYGFWPVYLAGIRFPASKPERLATSDQPKPCGNCKGTGVVGGSGTSAEEVSKELLGGRSLCACEVGQGWESYLRVANTPTL